jgi:hypothetical protein
MLGFVSLGVLQSLSTSARRCRRCLEADDSAGSDQVVTKDGKANVLTGHRGGPAMGDGRWGMGPLGSGEVATNTLTRETAKTT